jgi:WD40 repeat protein
MFETLSGTSVEPEARNGAAGMYQYDAFITYRRIDGSAAAARLRHRLIDYRLPAGFTQRPLRIYLDRVYEHATEDFFRNTIQPALASSNALIVVQTPSAAASRDDGSESWVTREVRFFRDLPQRDRIWVALAIGDFADALPAGLEQELPNVERVDIRSLASRWRRLSEYELLKFIGPLQDVPTFRMPDLRRESEQRARTRLASWAAAALVVIIALATLSVLTFLSSQRAKAQQALAERRLADSVSRELASRAEGLLSLDYPLALRTTTGALASAETPEALNAARRLLEANTNLVRVLTDAQRPLWSLAAGQGKIFAGGANGMLLSLEISRPFPGVSVWHPLSWDVSKLAWQDDRLLAAEGPRIRYLPTEASGREEPALDVGEDVRAFALHRRSLAVGYMDGTLQIWDSVTRSALSDKWKAAKQRIVAVKYAPDGRQIAVVAGDEVKILDGSTGRILSRLRADRGAEIWSVAWHPQLPMIAFGDSRGIIYLWSFQAGSSRRRYSALEQEGRVVRCLAFGDYGRVLVAGFEDGTLVALEESLEPRISAVVSIHRSPLQDLLFVSPTRFVSAGYDGRLALWDLEAGSRISYDLTDQASTVVSWGTPTDGALAILENRGESYELRSLRLPGIRKDEPAATFASTTAAVDIRLGKEAYVAIDTDGSLTAKVRDQAYSLGAGSIQLSPDTLAVGLEAELLAVAVADERQAGAWSLTGEVLIPRRHLSLNGYPRTVAWCPDGSCFLVLDTGGGIHLVPAATTAPLREIQHDGPALNDFEFLSAHSIATAGPGPGVSIWRLDSLTLDGPPLAFPGHGDAITRIALSPDRKILFAGDIQGRIMSWDLETRTGRLAPFTPPWGTADHKWISELLVTADNYVVSRLASGSVVATDFDPRRWRRRACLTAGSCLSQAAAPAD